MSELREQISDTADDDIGSLLAQARAIETMTMEKRGLIARTIEAMRVANYVSIRGTYQSYNLSRIGQSCHYDIPKDRRGALLPFRGMRVRMVCVENTGRNGRVFLAGPVS
jgi:hypothetical protein